MKLFEQIIEATVAGDASQCAALAQQAIDEGVDPFKTIQQGFNRGMPNFLSCDALCWASRYLAYCLVQGYWNPCPDFEHSDLIIFWGTNPPASHPTFMGPVNTGRKQGARLIVVDPRLSQIARQAACPGSPTTWEFP
ncbi:MAG: molybdopterin-dependent oxidoreductase [Spirochaetota bacterium]